MAFDCHERKPLLYADLFKRHRNMVVEKEEENRVLISSKLEGSSSSLSSNQWSSCDSSSSGFSTPLCSDLSDDGDFFAELSRQMAECMLQEDEENEQDEVENAVANNVYQDSHPSCPVKDYKGQSYVHSDAFSNLKKGIYSSPVNADDNGIPQIQVYQLKNQPSVSKEGLVYRGRRVNGTESTQQKQLQKTEQHFRHHRGRGWGNGQYGSGMQAVFLGGTGLKSGSTGTGVFLPRDPTETKKKSGCPMVLMPTRVLQALELHFNRIQDSTAPPQLSGASLNHSSQKDESIMSDGLRNGQSQQENGPARNDEMQLPQEWTY